MTCAVLDILSTANPHPEVTHEVATLHIYAAWAAPLFATARV